VRFENTIRPSGTWPIPRATILWAGSWVMSSPRNLMVPLLGLSSPEMVRSVVVFPAPLPPMSVTMEPRPTRSDMPRSAEIAP